MTNSISCWPRRCWAAPAGYVESAGTVSVAGRPIGPNSPAFIIAEAGLNHNGRLDLAMELVEAASRTGADAVKFQTFTARNLASPLAPASAQAAGRVVLSQVEMLRPLELHGKALRHLKSRCAKRGILFMSSVFDEEGADFLESLQVEAFKIPSGEITNLPLLEHVAHKGKPVFISTGMSRLGEVEAALAAARAAGNRQIVLLHCLSSYPADPAEANLRAIPTMTAAFGVPVGYSDHTPGLETALAAVTLGASVIEKHLTLDRNLPGPDHAASAEPDEMAALVKGIRTVEAALGHGRKEPAGSEEGPRTTARKSLFACRPVREGQILKRRALRALRPAGGISPAMLSEVAGKKAARNIKPGQMLQWEDLV